MPQSDSKAWSSPECGVAVSRTTVRARPRKRCRRTRPIGVSRQSVRFVEHDDVPDQRLEGAHHFRALDEVNRRDGHRTAGPGIGRAPCRSQTRQRGRIGEPGVDAEPFVKLGLPLFPERCRSHHEHPAVARSLEYFCDDERRLNRFAEADFVCDQDPGGHPVRDRERRLELE